MTAYRIEASPYAGLWIDETEVAHLPDLRWAVWDPSIEVPTALDVCYDARNQCSVRFASPDNETLHEIFFPDPHPSDWLRMLLDRRQLILANSDTAWTSDETLKAAWSRSRVCAVGLAVWGDKDGLRIM